MHVTCESHDRGFYLKKKHDFKPTDKSYLDAVRPPKSPRSSPTPGSASESNNDDSQDEDAARAAADAMASPDGSPAAMDASA